MNKLELFRQRIFEHTYRCSRTAQTPSTRRQMFAHSQPSPILQRHENIIETGFCFFQHLASFTWYQHTVLDVFSESIKLVVCRGRQANGLHTTLRRIGGRRKTKQRNVIDFPLIVVLVVPDCLLNQNVLHRVEALAVSIAILHCGYCVFA